MKPRILCVDDEPMILDSLSLTLGRQYDVVTAISGADGLQELKNRPDISVVISDMRMPNMTGAEFLQRVTQEAPLSVRMLLTGETDIDSAVRAVNEGHIFRFLKKPCPPPELLTAVQSAYQQYRLITSEKQLLEQTLLGSISTMAEIMGLISPSLFGRVDRIKKTVRDIATKLDVPDRWQVEIAAVVSQLGLITFPHDMVDRLCVGKDLTLPELKQIEQLPAICIKLIKHIPRLEGVIKILEESLPGNETPLPGVPGSPMQSAQILKVAGLYERYTTTGMESADAIRRLSQLRNEFDIKILEALAEVSVVIEQATDEFTLPASKLRVDMIILEDIILPNGSLFAPKGFHVTESLVHRIQNFGDGAFSKPIRVHVQSLEKVSAA